MSSRTIFPAQRRSDSPGGRYSVSTRMGASPGSSRRPKSAAGVAAAANSGRSPSANSSTNARAADRRLAAYRSRNEQPTERRQPPSRAPPAQHQHSSYSLRSPSASQRGGASEITGRPRGSAALSPKQATPSKSQRHHHDPSSNNNGVLTPNSQRNPVPQLPTTPGGSATVPASVSEQLQLFTRLQQTVVQLSQCAVEDKKKITELQKTMDQYAALISEQDAMIDDLKKTNVRLLAEKEALCAFRSGSQEAAAGGSRHPRVPPISFTPDGDIIDDTREIGDPFTRSLVEQLRHEKRQRLEVEEQASRMMAEQQLMILRLEEKMERPGSSRVAAGMSPLSGTPRSTAMMTPKAAANNNNNRDNSEPAVGGDQKLQEPSEEGSPQELDFAGALANELASDASDPAPS